MTARWILRAALAAAASLGATGCFGSSPPKLWITDVEVTGETDFGALEVEVHLFDADTAEYLGCSGQDQGLRDVDASDLDYAVDAHFVDPGGVHRVSPDDLVGRAVEIQVIEDDQDPCPVQPGAQDDVIGISDPIDGASIGPDLPLAFDRVVSLHLAVD
jgi:hypothetical protein